MDGLDHIDFKKVYKCWICNTTLHDAVYIKERERVYCFCLLCAYNHRNSIFKVKT